MRLENTAIPVTRMPRCRPATKKSRAERVPRIAHSPITMQVSR